MSRDRCSLLHPSYQRGSPSSGCAASVVKEAISGAVWGSSVILCGLPLNSKRPPAVAPCTEVSEAGRSASAIARRRCLRRRCGYLLIKQEQGVYKADTRDYRTTYEPRRTLTKMRPTPNAFAAPALSQHRRSRRLAILPPPEEALALAVPLAPQPKQIITRPTRRRQARPPPHPHARPSYAHLGHNTP